MSHLHDSFGQFGVRPQARLSTRARRPLRLRQRSLCFESMETRRMLAALASTSESREPESPGEVGGPDPAAGRDEQPPAASPVETVVDLPRTVDAPGTDVSPESADAHRPNDADRDATATLDHATSQLGAGDSYQHDANRGALRTADAGVLQGSILDDLPTRDFSGLQLFSSFKSDVDPDRFIIFETHAIDGPFDPLGKGVDVENPHGPAANRPLGAVIPLLEPNAPGPNDAIEIADLMFTTANAQRDEATEDAPDASRKNDDDVTTRDDRHPDSESNPRVVGELARGIALEQLDAAELPRRRPEHFRDSHSPPASRPERDRFGDHDRVTPAERGYSSQAIASRVTGMATPIAPAPNAELERMDMPVGQPGMIAVAVPVVNVAATAEASRRTVVPVRATAPTGNQLAVAAETREAEEGASSSTAWSYGVPIITVLSLLAIDLSLHRDAGQRVRDTIARASGHDASRRGVR